MDLTDDERNMEIHQMRERHAEEIQEMVDLIDQVDHMLQWGKVFDARNLIDQWREKYS